MIIEQGTQINGLTVETLLGRGGNCEVYKALDSSRQGTVALKILIDAQNVMRFKREFRSMSRLDHPNIAQVYDYGEYAERAYFTMEYIEGGDLKQRIRKGKNGSGSAERKVPITSDDFNEIKELFVKICEPLEYIHSRKIIHRDLKPANIMLTQDSQIKLMDFGLIKEADILQESLTQTGAFVGTVNYMSPEQGMCRNLDHRTDIYSLGIILYEMLTGQLPFTGTGIMDMFMKHIQEKPEPPRNLNRAIPVELEQVTLQMLSKQPAERPNSVGEIVKILQGTVEPVLIDDDQTVTISFMPESSVTLSMPKPRSGFLEPGLIGREGLLQDFIELIPTDLGSPCSGLLVSGETGIGKSKLLNEMGMAARMRYLGYYRGSCLEIEQFPYGAILQPLEAIAERLKTKDKDDCEAILSGKGAILAKICPRFAEIESVRSLPQPVPLDHAQEKLRAFDAIKTVLENYAKERPFILVIDDFHWADELSSEFLIYLVRSLSLIVDSSKRRILPVISFKKEEISSNDRMKKVIQMLGRIQSVMVFELTPLDHAQVQSLLSAMLGIANPNPDLVSLIFRESGGNPFYIEEILRGLYEEKILNQRGDHWFFDVTKLKDSVPEIADESITSSIVPVSERVRDIISRRLDRLDNAIKNVLTRAAVIGIRFDFELLLGFITEDEDTLLDYLDEALRLGVIEEVPGSGGESFRFHHQMIRSVLYFSLQSRRRNRVHHQVAETILKIYGAENQEKWDIIAYHYDRSQKLELAIKYYIQAARYKSSMNVFTAVKDYTSRALRLLNEMDADPEIHFQAMSDARILHGKSSEILGDNEAAEADYQAIVQLGNSQKKPLIESLGLKNLGYIQMGRAQFEAADASFRKSLELIPDIDANIKLRAKGLSDIAELMTNIGNYMESVDLYGQARKMLITVDAGDEVAICDANIGRALFQLGKYEIAFSKMKLAEESFRKSNNLEKTAGLLNNLAAIYLALGDMKNARVYAEETLKISRKIGQISYIASILNNLGFFEQVAGNYTSSLERYSECLEIYRKLGAQSDTALVLLNLGTLNLEKGKSDAAFKNFDEALRISMETRERWLEAYAHHHLGDFWMRSEVTTASEKHFTLSLVLSKKLGLKTLECLVQSDWAGLKYLNGQREIAETEAGNALKDALALGDADTIVLAYWQYARILYAQNKFERARIISAAGLKTAIKREDLGYQWRFFSNIGLSLVAESRVTAGLKSLQAAVNIVKNLSNELNQGDSLQYQSQPLIRNLLEMWEKLTKNFPD